MWNQLKIGVFVTGGIAAYKVPDFVRSCIKLGAQVRVAMTPASQAFATPKTFEVLCHYPVLIDHATYPEPVGHIHLADWLDLAVVMPATANSLAKLTAGIADNELMSCLLAVDQPLVIVPAMNNKMWSHPATKRNVAQLRADGHLVLEPGYGYLAEGYEGKGRMPEPAAVLMALQAVVAMRQGDPTLNLQGQQVVISAGGTREAIDPVRYLTNYSSGKMGVALAYVAAMAGAEVTLVRTPGTWDLPLLPQMKIVEVVSAQDLYDAMHAEVTRADMVIMAAAVGDYRMEKIASQKLKKVKANPDGDRVLHLVETPDILASLPKDRAVVVGFAAETQGVEQFAKDKLLRKGADLMVANDVSQMDIGFASDDNAVQIISHQGVNRVAKASKFAIAVEILRAAQAIPKKK